MTFELPSAALGSGVLATIFILGWLAKIGLDWFDQRRRGAETASGERSARVNDHATDVASLVQTVEILQKQNDRQAVTIERQDMEITALREELARQRLEYQAQNSALETKAAALQAQVSQLQLDIRRARGDT